MYNDNDEMYDVRDLDDDVKERKELIEEAKALDPEADWNSLSRQVNSQLPGPPCLLWRSTRPRCSCSYPTSHIPQKPLSAPC